MYNIYCLPGQNKGNDSRLVSELSYLGSIVVQKGGIGADIKY